MSFEDTSRIIALSPELMDTVFPDLLARYGEPMPDGLREVVTIGGHWDDTARTRKRAASYADGTIAPVPLIDGRIAFQCLWQSDLVTAWEQEAFQGVEELTPNQFAALLPEDEDT